MAVISRIAPAPDALVPGAQGSSGKPSQTDADTQLVKPPVGAPNPKGVHEVLKQQKANELDNQPMPEKDLRELARSLQETIDKATKEQYEVGFRQDPHSGVQVIEIRDKEGHLIKQYPQEKVLNLQRKMDELSGMVIDEVI